MKTLKLLIVTLVMMFIGTVCKAQTPNATINWSTNGAPFTRVVNVSYECGEEHYYRKIYLSENNGPWSEVYPAQYLITGSVSETYNVSSLDTGVDYRIQIRLSPWTNISWDFENPRPTTEIFNVFGPAFLSIGYDSTQLPDLNVIIGSQYGLGDSEDSLLVTVLINRMETWDYVDLVGTHAVIGELNVDTFSFHLPGFGSYSIDVFLKKQIGLDPQQSYVQVGSMSSVYMYNYVPTTIQEQPSNIEWLKVYPNPASDVITIIGLNKDLPIEIKDLTGRIVSKELMNTNSMNVSTLSQGMYILSQEDGRSIRFVKH